MYILHDEYSEEVWEEYGFGEYLMRNQKNFKNISGLK